MAKESSFDCVSEVNMMEMENAVSQAQREIAQRYDLKGTNSSIEFAKKDGKITLSAPSDFVAGQVRDILGSKMVKRQLELNCIKWGNIEPASGATVRQVGSILQGLDTDLAKRIAKDIRDLKLKCKPTVEGDKLRVTSASRDTLQEVIAYLRDQDYGQPLQFTNYR